MMNQKTATYEAIKSVIDFDDNTSVSLTKDQKAKVKEILVKQFNSGEIELKSGQDDLGKYVNGLINNWLRKDKRLNGGIVYQAKNPGSRAGQSDTMVKNLRLLKKTVTDESALADIDAAITARLAEIRPAKTVEIDATAIPEEFKHLLPEC
jgi:hypothetical protein